jgi:hypothetical protein
VPGSSPDSCFAVGSPLAFPTLSLPSILGIQSTDSAISYLKGKEQNLASSAGTWSQGVGRRSHEKPGRAKMGQDEPKRRGGSQAEP